MLLSNDIEFEFNCQGFVSTLFATNEENTQSVLMVDSKKETNKVFCLFCFNPEGLPPTVFRQRTEVKNAVA